MASKDVIYIIAILLLLLNAVMIFIAVKCAHQVDDDFEFYDDDDGNHAYYDRKLIRHNKRISGNSKSK